MMAQCLGRAPLPFCSGGWVASTRPSCDDAYFGAWCEVETAGASVEGKCFDAFFLIGRAGLSLAHAEACFRIG